MPYINTNLNSLGSQRMLSLSANSLGASMQRLSSGLRINGAKDDAAGMAIAQRFTAQIKGTDQAARNANDGISLTQTAEGALASIGDNLQRIRELAVQSANSTNSASDRAALQTEVAQLVSEVDRVATQTEFNGNKLLDGSFAGQQFQVGANAGQVVTASALPSARASLLGKFYGISYSLAAIVPSGTFDNLVITVPAGANAVDFGAVVTDAKAIAAAINTGAVPGLSASAGVTSVGAAATQTSNGSANGVATLSLNAVNISLNYVQGGGSANALNRSTAVAAINAQSDKTGVVATDTGTGVALTAADGRNIAVAYAAGGATGSTLSDVGLAPAGSTAATVNYVYRDPFHLASNTIQYSGAGLGGYGTVNSAAFTFATNAHNGTPLNAIDISTVAGANAAIQSADEALATVNSARAQMGALQNRFQSAIANLQTSSENMNASRSRIQDADFAQETANLSRAQILQQASTAMVAQANQSPQGVLALLK